MVAFSRSVPAREAVARLEVGDPLQPARYHAVLDDLTAHRRAATAPEARVEARRLLLHSVGAAEALLSQRCDHDVCWVLSGSGARSCLPATVEPEILVAACLQVCPAAGTARLHRHGERTAIGCRWPFDLARAADLVRRAAGSADTRLAAV